jgi:DNA polymerase III alpha subunit
MNRAVLSEAETLSDVETRAALRAVGRVLSLAGESARRNSTDQLADVLTSARTLPEMISDPDEFRARFRPALQRLAARHREYASVLSEFDRGTGTRRCPVEDDLWIDCGGDS